MTLSWTTHADGSHAATDPSGRVWRVEQLGPRWWIASVAAGRDGGGQRDEWGPYPCAAHARRAVEKKLAKEGAPDAP